MPTRQPTALFLDWLAQWAGKQSRETVESLLSDMSRHFPASRVQLFRNRVRIVNPDFLTPEQEARRQEIRNKYHRMIVRYARENYQKLEPGWYYFTLGPYARPDRSDPTRNTDKMRIGKREKTGPFETFDECAAHVEATEVQ